MRLPVRRKARKVLVVYCNPNPDSLGAAAKDRVVDASLRAGHEVVLLDLYADEFDPCMSEAEWRAHADDSWPNGQAGEHGRHLRWADTLVFVYPTWFGGQPAMLKGWLDRVMTNGVAYRIKPGQGHVRGLLNNISRIYVVTSHGSPKWINALQGEPGKRVLLRGLRVLCGPIVKTKWLSLYNVDDEDSAREAWLDRVENVLGP